MTIRASEGSLTERESALMEEIEVIELDPILDRTSKSESQLQAGREQRRRRPGHLQRLADSVDRQFPVDTWSLFFTARFPHIVREVRRIAPDVLWATGDPWSSLVTGARLARRLQLPYVADFRDPWTLCPVRTDGRWRASRVIDRRFERRVLTAADWVLFQARTTERKYRAHYGDVMPRSSTITNSFSRKLLSGPGGANLDARYNLDPRTLNLCFFGRFRSMSPASVVTRALGELALRDSAAAQDVRVYSFGSLNAEDAHLARALGVADLFHALPAVPLEDSAALLARFDLLVLSTDPRRQEIIPAKLFEYLTAGRPILSLSLNPEVGEILSNTGSGVQHDPADPDGLARLLGNALDAKRRGDDIPVAFAPNSDEINRYEAGATTAELAALFDRVLETRND